MFKAFEFRLPTNATKVPAGPKFLALVMLASAVAVSSTSAFAQTHKRTHYHSSNSMNVIRGPVCPLPVDVRADDCGEDQGLEYEPHGVPFVRRV